MGHKMSVTAISAFAPISSTTVAVGRPVVVAEASPAESSEVRWVDNAARIEPSQGDSHEQQSATVSNEIRSIMSRTAIPESMSMLIGRLDRVDLAHQALSRVRVQLTSTLEEIQKMKV